MTVEMLRIVQAADSAAEFKQIGAIFRSEGLRSSQLDQTAVARKTRGEQLKPDIGRVWEEHRRVYGPDKVWAQLKGEGQTVARCTVERLMRELGLLGVVQGRRSGPTGPTKLSRRTVDLVERQFYATAPNRLWVADLTYVKTHSG